MRQPRTQLRKSMSTNADREALGESFPCTGAAAALEDALPGRGLCVSMQRGLGVRTSINGHATEPSKSPEHLRNSTAPGCLVPSTGYEASVEDPIDRTFEVMAKQVDPGLGRFLFVRRFGPGDYEVDGARVNVGWRRLDSGSREAYIFDQSGPVEPLAGYLQRVADGAAKRSRSFTTFGHGSVSLQAAAGPPPPMTQAVQPTVPMNNLYSREAGSFYSRDGGSFYMVPSVGPKDVRIEAMRAAGAAGGPPPMVTRGPLASAPSATGPSRVLSPVMRPTQATFVMQGGDPRRLPQPMPMAPHPQAMQHLGGGGHSAQLLSVPTFVAVSG